MKIYTFSNNDELHHRQKSLIIDFKGNRNVLSTSAHNGGYHENLQGVFNHDCKDENGDCNLNAPTYEEHMILLTKKLGLNPDTAVGIMTAANMENVSIKSLSYGSTTVTAVVTGGIEVNGGRVGDPASWREENGTYSPVTGGTINIMLSIDANLSKGGITRALVTCTEAKTAAIQELLAPSNYSYGLATGSGTDGTIIITNRESPTKLTNAGKHSKLGELIGLVVKTSVKEALEKQTGLSPKFQHNILKRMSRFGITKESLWESYITSHQNLEQKAFLTQLSNIAAQDNFVTYTSLYAHLIDQLIWELISPHEAITAGNTLLELLQNTKISTDVFPIPSTKEVAIQQMIENYKKFIAQVLSFKIKL